MTTTQPEAGSTILHDTTTGDTWCRDQSGALSDLTRDTIVDASSQGSFTVAGKRPHPVAPEPWRVTVVDDAESTERWRCGQVQAQPTAWAYCHEEADALRAFGGLA